MEYSATQGHDVMTGQSPVSIAEVAVQDVEPGDVIHNIGSPPFQVEWILADDSRHHLHGRTAGMRATASVVNSSVVLVEAVLMSGLEKIPYKSAEMFRASNPELKVLVESKGKNKLATLQREEAAFELYRRAENRRRKAQVAS